MVLAERGSSIERAAALAADFAGRAAEHDRSGSFPFENFAALHDAGLLALTVPAEFGGGGAGLHEVCRVISAVAGGDASTALVLAMQYIYAAGLAHRTRQNAVREQLYRAITERGAMLNTMRVEPELGTPARGGLPRTTATPTDGGWSISGHKLYATGSHDLLLHEVQIPTEYALDVRYPVEWQPPDPAVGVWNGLVLAALYDGIARAARDWLLSYLHERVPANLGASLATLPRFQSTVGEIQALLYANERLIYGLAEQVDRDGPAGTSPQASLVKYLSTNNAVRAVDTALGLIGNPGLSRSHPLERYHRDVLCSRIHTPQDDMVLLAAGKAALGISP